MGLFNHVVITGICPECGQCNDDWQTKDAEVLGKYHIANYLETVEFADITGGEIYSNCSKCDEWLEFEIAQ